MVHLFGFDLVICKSGTSKNNVISINLSYKSKIRSSSRFVVNVMVRDKLAPVLKTFFHQCVTSYTCSQSYSDGSI